MVSQGAVPVLQSILNHQRGHNASYALSRLAAKPSTLTKLRLRLHFQCETDHAGPLIILCTVAVK